MRRLILVLVALAGLLGVSVGRFAVTSVMVGLARGAVSGLNPNSGPVTGGTSVVISGNGFLTTPALVCFGASSAGIVTPTSSTQITVTSPASPLPPPGTGTVTVVVADSTDTCSTIVMAAAPSPNNAFTYTAATGGGAGSSSVVSFSGVTYVVSPDGDDVNNSCVLPMTGGALAPAGFACRTIQGAINKTRDRDLVNVLPGVYDIATPIEVPNLIEIFASSNANGGAPTPITTSGLGGGGGTAGGCASGTGVKVVLRSATGQPIFHVTGVGSPTLFPVISGFILGGTTDFTNPGAIQLDGTTYAQVQCNIVGQEDLPNMIGILLRNTKFVVILNNTIHGSTQYPIAPTLGPVPPVGGFGIVTSECLGNGHSDDAAIINNLLTFNSNAGLLFCSDGTGGHLIVSNSVINNGRGIVLRDANDVVAAGNAISNNYYDGIEILDTSTNNIISTNTIESQEGPNSTGILLQGNGTLFPLNNAITANFLRRNTTNIYVIGARRTLIGVDRSIKSNLQNKLQPAIYTAIGDSGNVISAVGDRSGIVFALGNPTGMGLNSASPSFGQPSDTLIRGNTLTSNGPCGATRGCAIRLTAGVIVDIDATTNEWGVTNKDEIRAMIWDKYHDAALGRVITYFEQGTPVATATRYPTQAPPPPVNLGALSLSSAASTPAPLPVFPAAPSQPAGAGAAPPPPTAYIDPATGSYYVDMTLCVTSASGQPVPNDRLTISIFDTSGNALSSVNVTTAANGCFIGAVQAAGGGGTVLPGTVAITDPSGAVTSLPVTQGAPQYRPPANPPVTR